MIMYANELETKEKQRLTATYTNGHLNAQPGKCVSAKSKIMQLKIRKIEGVKLNLCFLRELFLTYPVSTLILLQ